MHTIKRNLNHPKILHLNEWLSVKAEYYKRLLKKRKSQHCDREKVATKSLVSLMLTKQRKPQPAPWKPSRAFAIVKFLKWKSQKSMMKLQPSRDCAFPAWNLIIRNDVALDLENTSKTKMRSHKKRPKMRLLHSAEFFCCTAQNAFVHSNNKTKRIEVHQTRCLRKLMKHANLLSNRLTTGFSVNWKN